MYRPKNAIGFEASWPNSKRYLPPTRTSASQESRDTPVDFGAHHRLSSSGLVHASNTMRAGPHESSDSGGLQGVQIGIRNQDPIVSRASHA